VDLQGAPHLHQGNQEKMKATEIRGFLLFLRWFVEVAFRTQAVLRRKQQSRPLASFTGAVVSPTILDAPESACRLMYDYRLSLRCYME